jgi:hypothetical protein
MRRLRGLHLRTQDELDPVSGSKRKDEKLSSSNALVLRQTITWSSAWVVCLMAEISHDRYVFLHIP